MTLVKWDPFRDLLSLNRRMSLWPSEDACGTWAPSVDIFEHDDNLVIRAELPGVERDDIDISVENNTLVLRGERKREKELKEENAYRLERVFGVFTRSFSLPKTVDPQGIAASYKNGVLEIRLPKAEAAKPRKVEIEAA
jgi:HSP20 family protein